MHTSNLEHKALASWQILSKSSLYQKAKDSLWCCVNKRGETSFTSILSPVSLRGTSNDVEVHLHNFQHFGGKF